MASTPHGGQVDFSTGDVRRGILDVAAPMLVAQVLNLLYNIVDRIYIGKIPGEGTLALAGLGLCFPIVTLVTAFANLFGVGGAPLCSIARGQKDDKTAGKIMANAYFMLVVCGLVLTVAGLVLPQTGALPLRRQRRHLPLRRRLSGHLPAGHRLRHDLPGPQPLHQQPGLRPHRHAHRAAGRRRQHRAGTPSSSMPAGWACGAPPSPPSSPRGCPPPGCCGF